MRCVDLEDLACREAQVVEDYYLEDWFRSNEAGGHSFFPPSFYLKEGTAFFINGRHRVALLSRHLDIIPLVLTQMDKISKRVLESMAVCELGLDEVFEIPDLPVKKGLHESI